MMDKIRDFKKAYLSVGITIRDDDKCYAGKKMEIPCHGHSDK